jgi:D-arabinose 1-dehydrogenase-like Zn-dependent alcohol dehydrogenase
MADGEVTQGGYSTCMVVKESFVLSIRKNLHRPSTAPLLCAGITVYSPMRHYGADKKGHSIAVVGLGGLGHMVVKCAPRCCRPRAAGAGVVRCHVACVTHSCFLVHAGNTTLASLGPRDVHAH